MNREKLEKFVSSCRSLAAELEAGEGPQLESGQCFFDAQPGEVEGAPACAIGHVLYRAGYRTGRSGHIMNAGAIYKFAATSFDTGAVMAANDRSIRTERARAVIKPLRELADRVERDHLGNSLPNLEQP